MTRIDLSELAYTNGRVAFESGRPLKDSNPYRRGTVAHAQFIAGYEDAALQASMNHAFLGSLARA